MRPTAFLDRDGTLNREVDFVRSPDQLVVLPGVRLALHRLRRAGWGIVVVTNQSGVARGHFGERELAAIHARLHDELDGLPDAYLHCPHHPNGGFGYGRACACRKPGAGLLHEATALLGADLAHGAVVGDSARDVLMARGTRLRTVLVRSGKPVDEQLAKLAAAGANPDFVADGLPAAVDWLLAP
ncbi:MAG: HAD-IIIA family hydrolase [Planctomycetes bacterium]|nr:HAD-IIIA family hydrolase [Planctomycetota bacterium]